MKKIGVMTFSRSINYGAFLQSYALQRVLKEQKMEPSLIDYENPIDVKRYRLICPQTPRALVSSIVFLPIVYVRKKHFKDATKLLKYTPISAKYDVAIAGSDQIWNPKLTGGKLDEKFFLKGINAGKKISYAASIANEKVIDEKRQEYKKYLEKLDCISVRELSTKEKLSEFINKPIFVAADPVLLLTKEEWGDIIKDKAVNSKPYIFTYFVGDIKREECGPLARACEKLNMECVTYSKKPLEKHIYKYASCDGPLEFLARLRDAKLVITSSFHGIVLSIIFHKNFYYFLPRADKRSRVDSILKSLGLTDRIIETEDDIDKMNLKDIDYTEPQKKLDKLRGESLNWLKKAIGD